MDPEHTPLPQTKGEKEPTSQLFGVECLIDKTGMGYKSPFIKISCRTAADAEIIIRGFWREYDPRLYAELESGKLTYEGFGGTTQGRTTIVHTKHRDDYKCHIIVNQNGNPFRVDTLNALKKGGLII